MPIQSMPNEHPPSEPSRLSPWIADLRDRKREIVESTEDIFAGAPCLFCQTQAERQCRGHQQQRGRRWGGNTRQALGGVQWGYKLGWGYRYNF